MDSNPPQQLCWIKEINCEASNSEKVKDGYILTEPTETVAGKVKSSSNSR